MSEITGVDPRNTPASLRAMRSLIKAVRPAKYDLTPKTWANLRSNYRAALVHAAPRMAKPVDPDWGKLRAAAPNKRMRLDFSRFIGFCENHGVAPNAVCDTVVDRFRAYLETDTQVPDPHDCHRTTCRMWNKAAETVPGWPSVRPQRP